MPPAPLLQSTITPCSLVPNPTEVTFLIKKLRRSRLLLIILYFSFISRMMSKAVVVKSSLKKRKTDQFAA